MRRRLLAVAGRRAFSPRLYGRPTVGPWTHFKGGFLFTEPQCLRLDVYERGGAVHRYAEPFGRPPAECP
jgi:hypothetical protein